MYRHRDHLARRMTSPVNSYAIMYLTHPMGDQSPVPRPCLPPTARSDGTAVASCLLTSTRFAPASGR